MNRTILSLIIASLLFIIINIPNSDAATNKHQESDLLHITRWYKIYWLGMHVADLVSEIKEEKKGLFHIESHINTKGMVKRLTKYKSITKSYSLKNSMGNFIPDNFESSSRLRKKRRTIEINYNDTGLIDKEKVIPADNRLKRPAVDNTLKIDSVDPHTAILVAHKEIRKALVSNNEEFSIALYDARRMSKLNFTVHGRKIIKHNDKDIRAIHVSFYREAVAGYTGREKERMENENPIIDIYLEDNEMMLPIKALAEAPIGSASAILERQCYDILSCESTPADYAYVATIPW